MKTARKLVSRAWGSASPRPSSTRWRSAAAEGWSYSHFAAALIEGEMAERRAKRARLNLRFANFPYLKRLDDFDYAAQPSIDRRLIEELASGRYLGEGRNIVLLGPGFFFPWRATL